MTTLISILAFGTLGAFTIFGIVNERATLKRLDDTKKGRIGHSALSENGIRERQIDEAERQPS